MKSTCRLSLILLLSIRCANIAHAISFGTVFQDATRTGKFGPGNVPLPGVLVVVTNTSGTFSNAMFTTAAAGSFSLVLGAPTDTYVEFLAPSTLPAGAVVEQPAGGVYTFSPGPDNPPVEADFLVSPATNNTPHLQAAGFVLLDVNQTGQFALNDVGVPGVLVVVTNSSGTFSNASLTSGPAGGFSIPLASSSDKYTEYLLPSSLPLGTNVLVPTAGLYKFTLGANQTFAANFLIGGLPRTNAPQAQAVGLVLRDVNQTGRFEPNDVALPSVLVVVTNLSGTFSNASLTTASEGAFTIPLGSATDTYVEYLQPASLPAGATVEQPANGFYTFALTPNNLEFSGNFLVSGLASTNAAGTNNCSLEVHGTIDEHRRHAQLMFSGSAFSACDATNGVTGEWNILARDLHLHFTGSVFAIVDCGEQTNSSGVVTRFIDFQGAGNLKGFHGPNTDYGVVTFTARAVESGHSRNNPDSLYFRVDTAKGTTVLLISGDTRHPTDVVPVALSTGKVNIDTNPCQSGGANDDEQGNDDGNSDNGEGHNGKNQAGGNSRGDNNGKHGGS